MKKIILIIFILIHFLANAQVPVGSGFSYQGELLDNGYPANGDYDLTFTAYETEISTLASATVVTTSNLVTNGLINISSIDFEINNEIYFGDEIWMEIEIKKSSDPGGFETLTSRQRINAVPFSVQSELSNFAYSAGSLDPGFAVNHEVLTFDGSAWRPQATAWQEFGNIIGTRRIGAAIQVLLGTSSPTSTAKLTVVADTGINTQYKSTANIYNEFLESGVAKGYIGSLQDGANTGTNSNDFEMGTSSANGSGNVHLTINAVPKFTVTNNGRVGVENTSPTGKFQVDLSSFIVTTSGFVGVGTNTPDAKLEVDAASNVAKSFSVKNNGIEKFTVHQNGGSSVGSGFVPPVDGLFVQGDIKHQFGSNGSMKYMARVDCAGSTSSLTSFYNGLNNNGSVSVTTTNILGRCEVNFPTNINTRYWQVTSVSTDGVSNANCHTLVTNSQLICQRTVSGSVANGHIMILVY